MVLCSGARRAEQSLHAFLLPGQECAHACAVTAGHRVFGCRIWKAIYWVLFRFLIWDMVSTQAQRDLRAGPPGQTLCTRHSRLWAATAAATVMMLNFLHAQCHLHQCRQH